MSLPAGLPCLAPYRIVASFVCPAFLLLVVKLGFAGLPQGHAPPAFLSILVELIVAGTIHLSLHPPQGFSGLSDALDYAKERETGTLRSCHWAGNVTGLFVETI